MVETVTVLDTPWSVDTPFGPSVCIAWHNYGLVHNEYWKVVLRHNRSIVFLPHTHVRLDKDFTLGLSPNMEPFPPLPEYLEKLKAMR